jgi:hypothetical protein
LNEDAVARISMQAATHAIRHRCDRRPAGDRLARSWAVTFGGAWSAEERVRRRPAVPPTYSLSVEQLDPAGRVQRLEALEVRAGVL